MIKVRGEIKFKMCRKRENMSKERKKHIKKEKKSKWEWTKKNLNLERNKLSTERVVIKSNYNQIE